MGDRHVLIRQSCSNAEAATATASRWQKGECQHLQGTAQYGDSAVARNRLVPDVADVVSARMRLLYDYRAPAGTRWSPTAEQLRELLALFHVGGLRTPSTAQISRITARLRAHGRIEGRNVFYWFQNQKARERKRRLQLVQGGTAAVGALPSENTISSNDEAQISSPQRPPAEEAQTMAVLGHDQQLQVKRCRLQEFSCEAGYRSSRTSSPEENECAVPIHQLWSSSKQAAITNNIPFIVEKHFVKPEANSGLCMHNMQDHPACSTMANSHRPVTKNRQAQLNSVVVQALQRANNLAAEDEKSEVSDATVQHCASSFSNLIWRADEVQCTGDEINSVVAAETRMQQAEVPALHFSTARSSLPSTALTLFPLSPTSFSPLCQESSLKMHGQNEDVNGIGLPPSLCRQSSLLDLKLAIDS